MTQYCGTCTGEFGARIEMEQISSGWSYTIYQCPCCTQTRKVSNGVATPVDTAEVQQLNKPSFLGTVAKVAVVGIVLAASADKKRR